jgi:NADPH:quinone reductase-like Zn-dependent oxidoreductase
MKAIRYYTYGSPDVIKLQDVDMPEIADDCVLVRVKAASVNPLDWHYMRGTPYFIRTGAGLSRPKDNTLGVDLAGYVEAIGKNVTRFQPGDEVFGARGGALAEYVCVRENGVIQRKPANLTFEEAASVPVAGFTALQALRDKARVQPGHKVLVNGAAGGVGTFAVQIAKALGAEVTGVCSTRNVEMVQSIGADRVIDYTREDFTRTGQRHDVMIDIAGGRALSECRRVLTPKAVLVVVGGPNKGQWLGPLFGLAKLVVPSWFASQRAVFFIAKNSKDDLAFLSELLAAGKVRPVIDRTYPLTEVPAAIGYLEEGHARGKVVITV